MQAARLLLERVIPPLKPVELPAPVRLDGHTFTARGSSVLAAVNEGVLAPSQAAQLLAAIGVLARVAEVDELAGRVAALEEARGPA